MRIKFKLMCKKMISINRIKVNHKWKKKLFYLMMKI